jgi:PHP family Zn ribbon phosphoesterase
MNTCSICLDELLNNNKVILNCEHVFCDNCLKNYLKYSIEKENKNKINCPNCREEIIKTNNNEINDLIKKLSNKQIINNDNIIQDYYTLLVNMNNLLENYNNIEIHIEIII